MEDIKSSLHRKVLKSQTRSAIANVIDFMDKEALEERFVIDCKKVQERVAAAVGVSESSVKRIKAEKRQAIDVGKPMDRLFETPNKRRVRPKKVTGLDEFDQGAVRRIVNNFYLVEKCLPTVNKIRAKLEKDLNFTGSNTSVKRILHSLGYHWKKTNTNKRILMEKHDIKFKRFVYLQQIAHYRAEDRSIVYMDETYIHSTHVSSKGWSDDSIAGISAPISKGHRLIVVHAGGEMGFIDNCLIIWKSGRKSGDYHDDMNRDNYFKWVKERLIPNLPPRSVLVIDNASYHNIEVDRAPTSNTRKATMVSWLVHRNIPHRDTMYKHELYELIKLHKPAHKSYVLDALMEQHGHSVLRLPPYHPELNTIELVWAEVKNWVRMQNVTFNIDDVENLTRQKFASISVEDWQRKCKHTKTVEREFMGSEGPLEDIVESFVIQLGADDASSSEDDPYAGSDEEEGLSGIEEL